MRRNRCGLSDRSARCHLLHTSIHEGLAFDLPVRTFATPGRRNPWDSVPHSLTCTSRLARRWSILVAGTCRCITDRKSKSIIRYAAIAECSMSLTCM
ncbi:hypothetical protein PCH70_02650 [Pseudomonas cichorii JBC1]|nr:hypothetical protein PCH70_02650 [Pseudomonas cichorii JBC1]